MDIAICTFNNIKYDIASFNTLDEQKLTILRRALICRECKAQGYFRKASRDGKPACFGAYHKDDCHYKTKSSALRIIPKIVEEVNEISTNNLLIEIDFNTCVPNKKNNSDSSYTFDAQNNFKEKSKQHTLHSLQKKNTKRGLSSLYRMLMHSDSFASSDIEIDTGAKHPFKAKNLFVHFSNISDEYIEKWRGYWGVISHANNNITWLNIANELNVSIPIENFKDFIHRRYKIKYAEDLAGSSVLVFGRLKKSEKNKFFIKVNSTNPHHIFIKMAK